MKDKLDEITSTVINQEAFKAAIHRWFTEDLLFNTKCFVFPSIPFFLMLFVFSAKIKVVTYVSVLILCFVFINILLVSAKYRGIRSRLMKTYLSERTSA